MYVCKTTEKNSVNFLFTLTLKMLITTIVLFFVICFIFANSVDPDQTAPLGLYTKISLKSLQEYSADDINRQHFQMQVFLAF